jgi:phosphoribosylformimino-5-aminoimidazole carboxamide ribotide isomerase
VLIIPSIDLLDGKCVRLKQGRRDQVQVYAAKPVEVAQQFEADGARMLHVVDLNGAFETPSQNNRQAVREVMRSVRIPVLFGGGLRTTSDIEELISAGASRVVVSTVTVESLSSLYEFIRRFGNRVLVSIASSNGRVATRGWTRLAPLHCTELARRVAAAGVECIVYTDIALDGTLSGVNIEEICAVARNSALRVIAAGGVGSLQDVERVHQASSCGIDGMIIGRAFYEGIFTLREAQEVGDRERSQRGL